jgi:hypothetical protein
LKAAGCSTDGRTYFGPTMQAEHVATVSITAATNECDR